MTFNIKEVTLYQSGVGFFNADCASKKFILPVNENDINDVLKSLSVDGLQSVRFNSAEEMNIVLDKLGIDINSEKALLSICNHLKGLEVNISADKEYTGIVIGVDTLSEAVDDTDDVVSTKVLVLKVNDEIQNIPINKIIDFELKDPIIQKDVESYLDLIANSRKSGVVNLHITAKKDSWASWIMPVSSWRLSYRVLFNKDNNELELFGISVIDNTTSIDWENIVLRLVTGKPISFQYNLFNPLFIKRPEILRDIKGVAPMVAEIGGVFDDFSTGDIMDMPETMGAVSEALPPPAPGSPHKAKGRRALRAKRSIAMDYAADELKAEISTEEIKPTIEAVKLEIGSAIAYEVKHPITIFRSQSALIPILTEKKKGELCVIIRDDRLSEAMDAIMLTKPIDLEKGAATVYLDGTYAGDTMVISGTEFLAFRINQDISVMKETETKTKIEAMDIKGAYLTIKRSIKELQTYKLINRSKNVSTLYLEVAKKQGYIPEKNPIAETKNYNRYKLKLKKGNSILKLPFENVYSQKIQISNLSENQIEEYLQKGLLSMHDKRKLNQLLDLTQEKKKIEYALQKVQKEIKRQFENQDRIRENIVVVKEDENLRSEYLEKLKISEEKLEKYVTESENLKKDLADIIEKLREN